MEPTSGAREYRTKECETGRATGGQGKLKEERMLRKDMRRVCNHVQEGGRAAGGEARGQNVGMPGRSGASADRASATGPNLATQTPKSMQGR